MATERARSGSRPGARPRPARAVGGRRGCRGSGRTGAAGGRGGRRGTGRIRPPADVRALCALSTAVGAPCVAPGCRKGVQRERRQEARGGPGGGGAERSPWAAAGRWKSPPVGAGSARIYLLERDILIVEVDRGRDCGGCRHGRGSRCRGRRAAALTLAHELDLVHDHL